MDSEKKCVRCNLIKKEFSNKKPTLCVECFDELMSDGAFCPICYKPKSPSEERDQRCSTCHTLNK